MAEFVDLNTKRALENHILEAKGRTNKTAKAYTKARAKKGEREKKRGRGGKCGVPAYTLQGYRLHYKVKSAGFLPTLRRATAYSKKAN